MQEKWKDYTVSPQSESLFKSETYEEFLKLKEQDIK
jgi:hypothetical protein